MNGIIDKVIGNYTNDNRRSVLKSVDKIKKLSLEYMDKDDSFFAAKTEEFKKRIKAIKDKKNINNPKDKEYLDERRYLDDILVEAIALCSAAIKRKLGWIPYDTQIEAAVAMQGKVIAEMKTGEGKTLVQMLNAYLNALDGSSVHIVTANDYLAGRDFEQNKVVFELLGLNVGLVQGNTSKKEKQEAYSKDIMYSTIKNISFDFLRDNTVKNKKDRVITRPFGYIIIDEADNTLIDEATTPVILSPAADSESIVDVDISKYLDMVDLLNNKLKPCESSDTLTSEIASRYFEEHPDVDFIFCRWNRTVFLSEKYLGNEELESVINATYFFKEGEEYLLKDKLDKDGNVVLDKNGKPLKQVIIIDKATGRIAASKKYMNGIQHAIEAKELYKANVTNAKYSIYLSEELTPIGICTYGDILSMYKSGVCGMTGTSSEIIEEIYGLPTYQVPTRKRNIRVDNSKIYINKKEKYEAIISDIEECYKIGRPVLIGTTSVKESLEISKLLEERGIIHNVLNAENESIEASIIANAGQFGSVTVSTNMAGRGTDIKLGEGVKELGGLHVIGTSRNKSLRIDNQLRGRASRQGEPGSSTYYSSLDDDRVSKFVGKLEPFKKRKLEQRYWQEKRTGIKVTDKSIETDYIDIAQKADEEFTLMMIRHTNAYKVTLVRQRNFVYEFRNQILDSDDIKTLLIETLKNALMNETNNDALKNIYGYLHIPFDNNINSNKEKIFNAISSRINELSKNPAYCEKMRDLFLKILDDYWVTQMEHLEAGRKQWLIECASGKDPMTHYEMRSHYLFDEMKSLAYREMVAYSYNPDMKYGSFDPSYEIFSEEDAKRII